MDNLNQRFRFVSFILSIFLLSYLYSCSSKLKVTKSSSPKELQAVVVSETASFSADGSIDYEFGEPSFKGIRVSASKGTCDICELTFTLIETPLNLTNSKWLEKIAFEVTVTKTNEPIELTISLPSILLQDSDLVSKANWRIVIDSLTPIFEFEVKSLSVKYKFFKNKFHINKLNSEFVEESEKTASEIVLPAPQAVSALAGVESSTLNWNSNEEADSYTIFWDDSSGVTTSSNTVANVQTGFVHSGLTAWKKYYYRVAAIKGGTIGELSSEVSSEPTPLVHLELDDSTPGIFCPRMNLNLSNPPSGITQYCIKENSTSKTGCVWNNLPIVETIRASTDNINIALTVWLRDENEDLTLGESGWTTETVALGATVLPADPTGWAAIISNSAISTNEIDELNCRVDQLSFSQANQFTNIRLPIFDTSRRRKASQQLSRIPLDSFGVTPAMSVSEADKSIWRLMLSTLHTGGSLSSLDISQADLTGRDISNFDFSGTNLRGAQLNVVAGGFMLSWSVNLEGLDLSGWSPTPDEWIGRHLLKSATNIPWAAINANTSWLGFNGADFSGMDLSEWSPNTAASLRLINLSAATNIPWAAINANTHTNGIIYADFRNTNLLGWAPPPTMDISSVKYENATNIPWAAINNNTHASGYGACDFTGQDLSQWDPAVTANIASVILSNATNIPWAKINANTHANELTHMNFSGVDLSDFDPPATKTIYFNKYDNATNIPWTALNANTSSNGLRGSSFSGVDLTGWNPPNDQKMVGIDLSNATNIPWAALNANTDSEDLGSTSSEANFSGLDLTGWTPEARDIANVKLSGVTNIPWASINVATFYQRIDFSNRDLTSWTPTADKTITECDFSNATNIPWALINANTENVSYGIRSNFTGVDLSGWNPNTAMPLAGLNFTDATNLPWAAINANTSTSAAQFTGLFSANFTNVDLTGWAPVASFNISRITYEGATNIPWSSLNANTDSHGFETSNFSGLDLSQWSPLPATKIYQINYSNAKNLPWAALNSNTHASGYAGSNFTNVDLTGFDPSGKSLNGCTMPIGISSPADFVEATGITPGAGTIWIDNTTPWG